ncbi:MAG: phosphatidate cytidylyltransferase [Lacibacter sp.]
MAFNVQTFKTRTITAILFAAVMLAGLLWNEWSFLLLFSIIHFGCWFEYQKLIGLIDTGYKNINPFHQYGVMMAGYGFMLFLTNDWFIPGTGVSLHAIGWILALIGLFIIPLSELLFSKQLSLKNFGYSVLGLIYISLSWALLLNIRSGAMWLPHNGEGALESVSVSLAKMSGYVIPLIIIGSIWINDTMAYIVGSLIGKTPLSSISPKKTWEGTVGGIILAIVVVGVAGYFIQSSSLWVWAGIAAISSVAGTFGDLLESKLKRMAGVKDSGSFMPGHGGFLDRFDSLLIAVPFVWLFLKLI